MDLRAFRAELELLKQQGLLREPDDEGRWTGVSEEGDRGPDGCLINACSNDYLGYANRAVSRETLSQIPSGSGASRGVHGTRRVHRALEAELASLCGHERALVFSSGYAANVGTVSALARRGDVIFSDARNHASLIDGSRLSRAHVTVFPHLDLEALEASLSHTPCDGQRWVLTESYFSMDGDSPDLPGLRQLCDTCGAGLVVDEAHALGVFGPKGAGLCAEAGVRADVLVGTFGKALGTQGAFVACCTTLRTWIWNRARSFLYSTALSPHLAAITLARLRDAIEDESGRARLHQNAAQIRDRLRAAGVPFGERSHGPIIPVLLGSPEGALRASELLLEAGILAQAIRPPTVPPGTSRLRISLSAIHGQQDIEIIADSLLRVVQTLSGD